MKGLTKRKPYSFDFSSVAFGEACRAISFDSGVNCLWSADLDDKIVSGHIESENIDVVYNLLARRVGAAATVQGNCYFIGTLDRDDLVLYCRPVCNIEDSTLDKALNALKSSDGSFALSGGVLCIKDRLHTLTDIVSFLDTLQENTDRRYFAEIYFVRVGQDLAGELSAKLKFNSVDLIAGGYSFDDLFDAYLDGDLSNNKFSVEQVPKLYLTENRPGVLTSGSEIVVEKSTATEGIISTSGYEKFTDGTEIKMLVRRVPGGGLLVDFDLDISIFEKNGSGVVPPCKKQNLQSVFLCDDRRVHYIGSLTKEEQHNGFSLFGLSGLKSKDEFTVWVRISEVG